MGMNIQDARSDTKEDVLEIERFLKSLNLKAGDTIKDVVTKVREINARFKTYTLAQITYRLKFLHRDLRIELGGTWFVPSITILVPFSGDMPSAQVHFGDTKKMQVYTPASNGTGKVSKPISTGPNLVDPFQAVTKILEGLAGHEQMLDQVISFMTAVENELAEKKKKFSSPGSKVEPMNPFPTSILDTSVQILEELRKELESNLPKMGVRLQLLAKVLELEKKLSKTGGVA